MITRKANMLFRMKWTKQNNKERHTAIDFLLLAFCLELKMYK